MLQRCAAFLGGAKHEYIIGESLNRLFSRAKEFNGSSKRIMGVPPQPPIHADRQTQLPRTQQGQRHRQRDSTHSEFEKLSRHVGGDTGPKEPRTSLPCKNP
jgi:hypothetical protein